MPDWPVDSANWINAFAGAAAVTFFVVCWLTGSTGKRGSVGCVLDIAVPLTIAGVTIFNLPMAMRFHGIGRVHYWETVHGLLFRALWLGLMLDQTSWVQRTTRGLRGRRACLPMLIWGLGLVLLCLAPLAARSQNQILEAISKLQDEPDFRKVDFHEITWLFADWGNAIGHVAVAMALVGAFALAVQAAIWFIRLGHAYLYTQVVEFDRRTSYAPGCLQIMIGVVVGLLGTIWLVWAAAALLNK